MDLQKRALIAAAFGAFVLPALLAIGATGSCSLEGLADAPEASSSSAASSSSSAAASSSASGGAPACPGDMALIESPIGAFCIDRFEVTNGDYSAFAAAMGTAPQQEPPRCTWNSDYASEADASNPILPVVAVDWCDAYAYCAAAGKHLCGRVGDGEAVEPSARDTATDQWVAACSNGLATKYPYGNMVNYSICNACDSNAGCLVDAGAGDAHFEPAPAAGGSFPNCISGSVHDMSGNVWEWENACDNSPDGGPAFDVCSRRGGSYAVPTATVKALCLACGCQACGSCTRPRSERAIDTGFRCCKERR